MSDVLPICFCGDNYLQDHMPRLLASIAATHEPGSVEVHIALDRSDQSFCHQLNLWTDRLALPLKIHDVRPFLKRIKERMGSEGPAQNHLNHMVYGRWYLPQILADYDRAVYLDMDLVVTGSLLDIFDHLPKNMPVAASRDFVFSYGSEEQQSKWGRPYLDALAKGLVPDQYRNSGVLALALDQWRNKQVAESLMATRDELVSAGKNLMLQDQDVLNVHFRGGLGLLPECFNVQAFCDQFEDQDMTWIDWKDARILHFCGSIKPWQMDRWSIMPLAAIQEWCRVIQASSVPLNEPVWAERGLELQDLVSVVGASSEDLSRERRSYLLSGLWQSILASPSERSRRSDMAQNPMGRNARKLTVDTLVQRMIEKTAHSDKKSKGKARKQGVKLAKKVAGIDGLKARWRFWCDRSMA